jgi:F-type H+-transporting ATPase subunit alpha
VREVLKQSQYQPIPVAEQMAVLLAVNEGKLDPVPISKIGEAKNRIQNQIRDRVPEVARHMESGEELDKKDKRLVLSEIQDIISDLQEEN